MFDLGISGQDVASHKMTTHTIQKGKFAGQTLELWQQDFGDFGIICREACEYWKTGYIRTYAENAKYLPADQREAVVYKAFEKASEMTYDRLPIKRVEVPIPDGKGGFVKDAAGKNVTKTDWFDYPRWWMLGTPEGQMQAVLLSIRKSPAQGNISLNEVSLMFRESVDDMMECMRKIGELGEPQILKNAESSPSSNGKEKATTNQVAVGNVIDKATRRRMKKQRQAERRATLLAGVTS